MISEEDSHQFQRALSTFVNPAANGQAEPGYEQTVRSSAVVPGGCQKIAAMSTTLDQEQSLQEPAHLAQAAHVELAFFPSLLLELQMLIFASAGAPLTVCKTSVAVLEPPHLLMTWLLARQFQHPLLTACSIGAWKTCTVMLSSTSAYTPSEYELFHALRCAAVEGQQGLVITLLSKGAGHAWSLATLAYSMTSSAKGLAGNSSQMQEQREIIRVTWEEVRSITGSETVRLAQSHMAAYHPFICAARKGHLHVCKLLFQQGVYGKTLCRALWEAASGGHLAVVQWLLAEVPGKVQQARVEALRHAAGNHHVQVVQYLLEYKEAHGSQGHSFRVWLWRCLYTTSKAGDMEMLRVLLKQECWFEFSHWRKALSTAVRHKRVDAVHLLLSLVSSILSPVSGIDAAGSDQLWRPRKVKIRRARFLEVISHHLHDVKGESERRSKIAKLLIEYGADMNARSGCAQGAAQRGHASVVHDEDVSFLEHLIAVGIGCVCTLVFVLVW